MPIETLSVLLSALLSIIGGGAFLTGVKDLYSVYRKLSGKPEPPRTYSERLASLMESLTKASGEVDALLREMSRISTNRELEVKKLETGLGVLEQREKELKEQISLLENVPIPVAEQFAKLVEPIERRSAKRDYVLFISGVVVTAIVDLLLRRFLHP